MQGYVASLQFNFHFQVNKFMFNISYLFDKQDNKETYQKNLKKMKIKKK